ncbi:MAG: NAD(P)-dependent oxidoreductase [Alphaproteobacteria bacterium]|nr:NAD(P)-dependent oxidoreductase [Alphaproteobacteria bacterium]
MSVLVIGGAGFIGRRLVPLLVARGGPITVMDIAPTTAFAALGDRVSVMRGDVTQFDDVMAVTAAVRPTRVVNLSYHIGSELPPRVAFKLNVLGMENCFEAARLCGVAHVVYASSLAVNGQQKHFGERPVNEDDFCYGDYQYAKHKIFNEWQAQDYRDKFGMRITGIRPANVTGPDKVRGSVDHVNCITQPARGQPVSFPFRDAMRIPVHVDDVAEVFARITLADAPKHTVYNTGGHSISLGELADMVKGFLPDAKITFEKDAGGRERSGNFMIDNRRLVEEFSMQYPPFRQRVRQIIDEVRADAGLPPLKA